MNKKKNNHYVPQFHLKQWSNNKKTIMTYNIAKDIYILDEPTSNLDKHTEKINEICNKFYKFENHNLLPIK